MLSTILGWLTGGGISAVGKQLNKAYQLKLEAKNDEDRIEAEKLIADLRIKHSILLSELSTPSTRWIRPAYAYTFWFYIFCYVVLDHTFNLMEVKVLPELMQQIMLVIISFYFLGRSAEKLVGRYIGNKK